MDLEPIREDFFSQLFYGDAGGVNGDATTDRYISFTSNWMRNLIALVPFLRELVRLHGDLYRSTTPVPIHWTWRDWLSHHHYDTISPGSDSLPMWLLFGQASWMLSCTYNQVLGYPAKVILDFYHGLRLGTTVTDFLTSSAQSGRMLRVKPSMAALELALSYGSRVCYNQRVSNVNTGRRPVVAGVEYDAVVVATEASSVKHVLSPTFPHLDAFARVQYQKSTLVIHTDASFMPPRRTDWCLFNVLKRNAHDACQLTAWLNQFYPTHHFPVDLFETWNPFLPPQGLIKELHFLRVVHTAETPNILRDIDEVQGKQSIFFAGAYSLYGMGLLEQAALSGRKVADLIQYGSTSLGLDLAR